MLRPHKSCVKTPFQSLPQCAFLFCEASQARFGSAAKTCAAQKKVEVHLNDGNTVIKQEVTMESVGEPKG